MPFAIFDRNNRLIASFHSEDDARRDLVFRAPSMQEALASFEIRHVTDAELAAAASASRPSGQYRMRFGKYKGRTLSEIPADYLDWLVERLSQGDERDQRLAAFIGDYLLHRPELQDSELEAAMDRHRSFSPLLDGDPRHPNKARTHR